jgi:hypothetical protein
MILKKLGITLLMIIVLLGMVGCGAKANQESKLKVHIAINGLNALLFFCKR